MFKLVPEVGGAINYNSVNLLSLYIEYNSVVWMNAKRHHKTAAVTQQ